jgi:hypothetical protein
MAVPFSNKSFMFSSFALKAENQMSTLVPSDRHVEKLVEI